MLRSPLVLGIITLLLMFHNFPTSSVALRVSRQLSGDRLHITILYESLCPDSRRFMRQLGPVHDELKDYVDILLVPFGKSYSQQNGAIFHCQHGPDECLGNRLQSCVLSTTTDQGAQVKFAVCQMLSSEFDKIETCAIGAGLSPNIKQCAETSVGTALQLEAERITNLYKPKFIPTIVYNGVFSQELQDKSLRNFRGTVCNLLLQLNKLSPKYSRVCQ
ncbi:GILT-like protein 1 isoform X2 [Scaptodrosophila lebanonensis]|uniref:GILT-like protein 1 isoform X2 n=1 Tax=Drosophila lebanonensis TaxID=7225 RepID=A0A6J2THL0_DROLE|nr:GILT-like protein 1 isoform X2 [Scaptodrosophila lebanonensis]